MSFYLKLIYLKTVSILSNLNITAKVILTSVLITLISVFWYLNFYTVSVNKINQELQTISSIDQEKAQLEEFIKRFINDPVEIENLNKKIGGLFDENIQTPERAIEELLQYAHSSDLTVNIFEEKTLSDKNGYFKKNITFDLVGNFYQVLTFLKTVANSYSVIKFNKFKINRLKEGVLKINFVCTVFIPKDK